MLEDNDQERDATRVYAERRERQSTSSTPAVTENMRQGPQGNQ